MTTIIECRPPVVTKTSAPDLKAVKARQQVAWSSGDYALIGATLQIVGERLAEAMDFRAGQTVLDVAAGNGNITLAAARRWCEVTSTDYVESLLESRPQARRSGGASDQIPDRGRRRSAVRRCVLRRRRLDFRRDVQPRSGPRRCRSGARVQARRPDRPRQLDARGLHRSNVQDNRKVPAAAGRCSSRRRSGVHESGCKRRSAPRRPLSPRSRATSSSAIARRNTSSTSSGPTMDLCSRHLRRLRRPAAKRSRETSSIWSDASTPRVTRPWSFPANISRLS